MHVARQELWRAGLSVRCRAVQAFHLRLFQMRFVIECDWLHRFGPQSKEVTDGKPDAGVCWSEDSRCPNGSTFGNGLPPSGCCSQKEAPNPNDDPQGAQNDEQRDHSAMRMSAVSDYFHTAPHNLKAPPKVCNHFLGVIPSLHDTRSPYHCRIGHEARGFLVRFPEEAHEQLQKAQGPPFDKLNIRDLSSWLWSSIDNDDSKDLDQIEYAVREGNGTRIYVGIADVTGLFPFILLWIERLRRTPHRCTPASRHS